jgi:hypothetical protein
VATSKKDTDIGELCGFFMVIGNTDFFNNKTVSVTVYNSYYQMGKMISVAIGTGIAGIMMVFM